MGEIGIESHRFLYGMKFWQVLAVIRGYRRRETGAWHRTRWLAFEVLSALGTKLDDEPLRYPQQLLQLPGDEQIQLGPSDEEIEELRRVIREENEKTDETR